MATIPKPKGVQARFTSGWAYLTVPTIPGYSLQVQVHQDGTWSDVDKWGTEYRAAMYQDGRRTEWRARYKRSGNTGDWLTGRVWWPDNFEEDGDSGEKPPAPTGLASAAISGDWFTVGWAPPAGVDELRVSVNDAQPEVLDPDERSYRVEGAEPYTLHRITVTAVKDGVESDPAGLDVLTTRRTDGLPGPADPERLEVVEVTATAATVCWHQPDLKAVAWWQAGAPGIDWQYPTEPQVRFTGLTPATTYSVLVIAHGHDKSISASTNSRITVTTTGGTPDPHPAQPSGLRVVSKDLPGGKATVAWTSADDAEFWRVRLTGDRWRVVRTPQVVFSGLTEGEDYHWEVKAVATDEEGYEYESVEAGNRFTFADTTPPPEPLKPPAALTVHCITTGSAKAEWRHDPAPEAWEVWLNDDRDNAFLTSKTLVALKELSPETRYRVNVVARQGDPGTPGYRESEPSTETFTTLKDQEKPPPPPPPIEGDLPAPKNLYVRADSTSSVTATWDDARPSTSDQNFYYATVDRRHWQRINGSEAQFDVEAGREYTVSVFGVFGNRLTSIAQKATTVRGGN